MIRETKIKFEFDKKSRKKVLEKYPLTKDEKHKYFSKKIIKLANKQKNKVKMVQKFLNQCIDGTLNYYDCYKMLCDRFDIKRDINKYSYCGEWTAVINKSRDKLKFSKGSQVICTFDRNKESVWTKSEDPWSRM